MVAQSETGQTSAHVEVSQSNWNFNLKENISNIPDLLSFSFKSNENINFLKHSQRKKQVSVQSFQNEKFFCRLHLKRQRLCIF